MNIGMKHEGEVRSYSSSVLVGGTKGLQGDMTKVCLLYFTQGIVG
jgi:hypothetical protein